MKEKKASVWINAATLILVLLFYASFVVGSQVVPVISASTRKLPIYSVETNEKKVALTFDAAWGADKTKNIMDTLDANNIKATFFLVGFWVDAYPGLTKEIAERGFEIGTHSETHPNLPKLSEEKIRSELQTSSGKITAITGASVKLFRPPFGDYDNKLLTIAEECGLKTIQWDVDTLDWKGLTGGQIALRVEKGARNGSIILCHNNSKYIAEALPLIISVLKLKGYTFATVGELIYQSDYSIDHTGRQRKSSTQ